MSERKPQTDTKVPIGPGTRVTLNFSIRLDDGELIDSTNGRAAVFEVGDGNLLPGFERALFGMVAGARQSLHLVPDKAFGSHNPENVQMMKRSAFGDEIEPSVGLIVSFADQQKAELPGVVNRLVGELVEVDFNHPLAGRTIGFDVEILQVEQVSNEILRV